MVVWTAKAMGGSRTHRIVPIMVIWRESGASLIGHPLQRALVVSPSDQWYANPPLTDDVNMFSALIQWSANVRNVSVYEV